MFFNRKVNKQQTDVIMEWGPTPRLFGKRQTRLRLEFNPDTSIFTIHALRGRTHERVIFREPFIDSVHVPDNGPRNVVLVKSRSHDCALVVFDIQDDKPRVERWRLESDAVMLYNVWLPNADGTYLLLPLLGDGECPTPPPIAIFPVAEGEARAEKWMPIPPTNILNTALYDVPYSDRTTTLARIHDPSTDHKRYAVVTAIHQTLTKDDITNEWMRQLSFIHSPNTSVVMLKWQPIAGADYD